MISVIMPCRNGEEYLEAAMRSVLSQETDLELILIDDASTDASRGIAENIAAHDKRVRILNGSGIGVSAARNAGLAAAVGEWIYFADADDLLPQGALTVLLEESRTADMVVGAHCTMDESGNKKPVWPESRWMDQEETERSYTVALRLIEGDSVLNIMCNKLHRRDFLQKMDIRLQENVCIAEDALFNLQCVLSGARIAYVHAVTYIYRTHSASAMHHAEGSQLQIHTPWFSAMRELLLEKGEMKQYYEAYADSVILRLYKDGGVVHVMKNMDKVKTLLLLPEDTVHTLSPSVLRFYHRIEKDVFFKTYPLRAFRQILVRKAKMMAFMLRRSRERRALLFWEDV